MEGASSAAQLRRQLEELQTDVGTMWKRREQFSGESSAPRALLAPPPPPPPAPPAIVRRSRGPSHHVDLGALAHVSSPQPRPLIAATPAPTTSPTASPNAAAASPAEAHSRTNPPQASLDVTAGSQGERTLKMAERDRFDSSYTDDEPWRSRPVYGQSRQVSPKAGYLVVEKLPQEDQEMTNWLCRLSDGSMSVSGLMGAMNQDIRRHSLSLTPVSGLAKSTPSPAPAPASASAPRSSPVQSSLGFTAQQQQHQQQQQPSVPRSATSPPLASVTPQATHSTTAVAAQAAAQSAGVAAVPATPSLAASLAATSAAAGGDPAPVVVASSAWGDDGRLDHQRQFRALAQSLAGLGARMYNWSLSAGLKEVEYIGFWNLILQYLDPCKQLDERIADTCKGIRKSLGESNESKLPTHQPNNSNNNSNGNSKTPSPSASASPSPSPSSAVHHRSGPPDRTQALASTAVERSFADTCYASARAIAQGAPLVAPENRTVLQPMKKHFAGTAVEEVIVTFTASQEALRLNGTYRRRPKVVVNGRPVYERGRKCIVYLDDGTWCIKDGADGDAGAFVYAFVLDAADEPFSVRAPWQVMDDGDSFVIDRAGSIHPYGSPRSKPAAGNQDGGSGAS